MNGLMQNRHVTVEVLPHITAETQIMDIISQHRETESFFKQLEEETGACVYCHGLFLPLGEAAEQFGFDLECVMMNIHAEIRRKEIGRKDEC